MNYTLTNDVMTVKLTSFGAELTSLTDPKGTEYIWNADERYWKRHTPVLFPIVGKVRDNEYVIGGKSYKIPAHGFARDYEFEIEKRTDCKITFALRSSLATKAMYPYDFCLKIHYTLVENRLGIEYEVINEDKMPMPFKIGAHPAFNCPRFSDETMEDYELVWEKEEESTQILINEDVYLTKAYKPFKTSRIPLSKDLFEKEGVLIWTHYTSQSMSLVSKKHPEKLTVDFKNFPFLGVWSPTNEGAFVCIEPWQGHADYVDDSLVLQEKSDIILLEAGQSFNCEHGISIFF
ncbi:galactose mutarotase [Sporanaerobium hydrogeniformans]|uniref:Galactose mutarotase n=1 Tax=Sporanaerobium hydrogeniformans TaxID=3072179 RepID=A0AC61DH58_9FIRM|nr:aldose 1-epimerase family protein [Sporanaerobium hydrogeniformans]PHV72140.1 galactose mutarotase [Sporanaerobium hydrogeniformans]